MIKLRDMRRLREPLDTTGNRLIALALAACFGWAVISGAAGIIHSLGVNSLCTDTAGLLSLGGGGYVEGVGKEGVRVTTEGYTLCQEEVSTAQSLADAGLDLPTFLFMTVALVLLARLLWTAADPGPYAARVPGRLRTLGWFVLIAGPLSDLIEKYCEAFLRQSMLAADEPYQVWFQGWTQDFPFVYVFTGLGVLFLSRLLRIDVRMGEDMERTI